MPEATYIKITGDKGTIFFPFEFGFDRARSLYGADIMNTIECSNWNMETRSGYYYDGEGEILYFADIAGRIYRDFPCLVGRHISVQLKALGLYESFKKGQTVCGLPFSFTDEAALWPTDD